MAFFVEANREEKRKVAMVTSRKRKRLSTDLDTSHGCEVADPPPFAPAHMALFKSHRGPLARSLMSGSSPWIVNLIIIAGHRLKARDFASAAAILPTLLRRYLKLNGSRWVCSREVAVTGAQILRRSPAAAADTLDAFLAHISLDGQLPRQKGAEGYTEHARESALLERVLDLLANGKLKVAFDALYAQSQEGTFRDCALVQGYLGVVALALSAREPDGNRLLRIASNALTAAATLQPDAYFYQYYAAATAIAAGNREEAIEQLREFTASRRRDDPIALFGLLSCLDAEDERQRQERVDVARRLLVADPMSKAAGDVLREAEAWQWAVRPPVDELEVALLFAARIEHGASADVDAWTNLGARLAASQRVCHLFWTQASRRDWWPSHFFRTSRINSDLATNPKLVAAKASVAQLLATPHASPYTDAVVASGAVELSHFDVKS